MNSKFAAPLMMIALVLLLCTSTAFTQTLSSPTAGLRVGFYARTCPQAETVVRQVVFRAITRNAGTAADIIRLHFHDCFVRGCDGSVLLNTVAGNPTAEKDSPINASLEGFDVIDEAKALLEASCPGTVSCADILAFAARDSSLRAGNIGYPVPSGRRDGRVSLSSEVGQNLPPPSFNAAQLRDNFAAKGLTLDEMVTLSGAHSIGDAHCPSFSGRLYNFNATVAQDPSLDPAFAEFLKGKCPPPGNDPNGEVPNDVVTPDRLDNQYYLNLRNHKGLFSSDQTLYDSPLTTNLVTNNIRFGPIWARKFGAAMVRMGKIDVMTGTQGEIRKNCHFVN